MAVQVLHYETLIEQALKGVVQRLLVQVSERGLPGGHHFMISFRTDAPGVELADYLRERYPNEITIVVQYEFWDLQVEDTQFAVTLSFSGVPERIVVPFAAMTAFADPSAKFGLQFRAGGDDKAAPASALPAPALSSPERVTTARGDAPPDDTPESADNVVALDRFRRK